MKHHYIMLAWMNYEAVCRMGAICAEQELHRVLGRRNVKGYKMISVDDEPIGGWEEKEWQFI